MRPPHFVAATIIIVVMVHPCSADNIDKRLLETAPAIMRDLRDAGYQNVGVLPFRLKRANQPTSFGSGLINNNLAARLASALTLANDPEKRVVGVVRNAGETALRSRKTASYRTPADRAELFELEYPLAWGGSDGQLVKPDAFLCGRVRISPNWKRTSVEIEIFDSKRLNRLRNLVAFEVPTDRFILADAGQGFSLSKGRRQFSRGFDDDDIIINIDEVPEEEEASSGDEDQEGSSSEDRDAEISLESDDEDDESVNGDGESDGRVILIEERSREEFPVVLKIYYDRVLQEPEVDGAAGTLDRGSKTANWTIPDPPSGARVTFRVMNRAPERVGVVLTINGVSTLYGETSQPDRMARWVLPPEREFQISGIYSRDRTTVRPVTGLSDEESRNRLTDFPDPGLIQLYVFRTTGRTNTATPIVLPRVMLDADSRIALTRGINQESRRAAGRGLMAPGAKTESADLKTLTLGDAELTDAMVIRYFVPRR